MYNIVNISLIMGKFKPGKRKRKEGERMYFMPRHWRLPLENDTSIDSRAFLSSAVPSHLSGLNVCGSGKCRGSILTKYID